jgi:hypothetical protein
MTHSRLMGSDLVRGGTVLVFGLLGIVVLFGVIVMIQCDM